MGEVSGLRPLRARQLPAEFRGYLAAWRSVRRYAVPRWMIDEATERRLAGDVWGACEAAGMMLELRSTGRFPPYLAEDLRHLAPDLLRWHLPRQVAGRGALTRGVGVLRRYPDGLALYARLPAPEDVQRVRLRLRAVQDGRSVFEVPRWQWDVRCTDRMRLECGGDATRVPFLHPDGTRLSVDELPDGPRHDDPVAHTEWLTTLWEHGRIGVALSACGIAFVEGGPGEADHWRRLSSVHPHRLVERLRSGRAGTIVLPATPLLGLVVQPSGAVELRQMPAWLGHDATLTAPLVRYPVDLDLLRFGYLTPQELHPLVQSALFPARGPRPDGGPRPAHEPAPVRVRCRGEWHLVHPTPDGLRVPHSDDEIEREMVLRAFGGRLAGCFQARYAWGGGGGWLPMELRRLRMDVFQRALHGDAPGVLALLDGGLDPGVRAPDGSTLLDFLPFLDLRAGGADAVRLRLHPVRP